MSVQRVEARLQVLAKQYTLDASALRRELARAVEDQSRLEEIAESHSCELAGWESVVRDLDERRTRALEAMERASAELMEIDGAFFRGHSVDECQDILREIRDIFERALAVRAESARFVLAVGSAAREPTHPDGAVVTAALRALVDGLMSGWNGGRLENGAALEVVATLAQVCGVLDSELDDPAAVLKKRLGAAASGATDLKALFTARQSVADARLEPGLPFEEITRRAQAIALGLWPDEPSPDS